MLTGPLLKKLLLFSLPLMVSSVLQLLFNAADVVVVGRYASYASLAAVGSTTAIVNLVVNLLIGMAVGVNVVVARYIGEGDKSREISAAIHTAVAMALVGGLILGGAGCAMAEWILRMISTPEDIFDLALTYLYIYFAGTPAIMLYNYGAAALRARGDTQRPLLFLTISGVTNVALNLLFVISLQMDVAGVALATVISETLSAVLVVVCLMRTQDELHFSWRKLRFDRRSLGLMAKVGIPAGVQGCLFSVANVVTGATLSAVACIWSEPLLAIYNQDPAVLAAGAVRLRMVVIPYVIFGIADVLTGAIRGCGSPMRPVVINLLCTCVFRLAWIAAIDTDTMAPTWVYASYPASWLLLLVVLLVCWCRLYRRKIKPNIARNGAAA